MVLATAMMETEVKGFPFVAHTIHSAVTASINNTPLYDDILKNCKKIYTFFKHNSMAKLNFGAGTICGGKKELSCRPEMPDKVEF